MSVSRDEYRAAILEDGLDEWQPLGVAVSWTEHYFPDLSGHEREAFVADLFRELLGRSQIAVTTQPPDGRRPRPLSPADARAAIDGNDWVAVGYFTTRAGAAETENHELCMACEGYVQRFATRSIDFEHELVSGTVPVCDEHVDQRRWPAGAAEGVAEVIGSMINEYRSRAPYH